MTARLLNVIAPADVASCRRRPVDDEAVDVAQSIITDITHRGEAALRHYAETLDGLSSEAPLFIRKKQLAEARDQIAPADRALLERVAERIETFAQAQREAITEMERPIPGGRVGHWIAPVDRAGCYAPGGRHPLPSSVLMTVIPARVAGVEEVFLASPHPSPMILAAASVAGADGVLAVGGAQAIAAMVMGVGVPACAMVVGPGNRYVTAAKYLLSDRVGIDMLAGPSELVVLADDVADPSLIAADLIAQAEHDPDAHVMLVAMDDDIIDRVEAELAAQLPSLTDATVARQALSASFAISVTSREEAIALCDQIAPEHLALHVQNAEEVARRVKHFGGLFIGGASAEVLGDYAAGPNHTLPTGGSARYVGGLSVLDFLRVRTYVQIDDASAASPVIADAQQLATLEGLEGHARSAAARSSGDTP